MRLFHRASRGAATSHLTSQPFPARDPL